MDRCAACRTVHPARLPLMAGNGSARKRQAAQTPPPDSGDLLCAKAPGVLHRSHPAKLSRQWAARMRPIPAWPIPHGAQRRGCAPGGAWSYAADILADREDAVPPNRPCGRGAVLCARYSRGRRGHGHIPYWISAGRGLFSGGRRHHFWNRIGTVPRVWALKPLRRVVRRGRRCRSRFPRPILGRK
jgi:hypothetical protein